MFDFHCDFPFPFRSDDGKKAFMEFTALSFVITDHTSLSLLVSEEALKLISGGRWDQMKSGLNRGTYGGGIVRASICITSLIVGRTSGFGVEHDSPNISKRLMSSSLILKLPRVARRLSAASKSLFS